MVFKSNIMKTLNTIIFFVLMFAVGACCSSKKQQKDPAAKDTLHDRNTRDPKIKDGPPKIELQDSL